MTSVRGSVVDVKFDRSLPPIHSLLRAANEPRVAIEVLMLPGPAVPERRVRQNVGRP